MSDDRELTPEQEGRVRRLLAEARVDEPIPGDVAGRLDRVLARLADGDPEHEPAEVGVLASRRRRRVAALLVAAAAVVVVGVGAGVVGSRDVSPTADSATSATDADTSDDTSGTTMLDSGAAGGAEEAAPVEEPPAVMSEERDTNTYTVTGAAPTRIRAAFFAIDVERVRARIVAASPSEDAPAPDDKGSADSSAGAARGDLCAPGAWGPGDLYLVRYAGTHAVLAFRPAVGDTQVVDLLQCGTADILRSVTLPGA